MLWTISFFVNENFFYKMQSKFFKRFRISRIYQLGKFNEFIIYGLFINRAAVFTINFYLLSVFEEI